MSTTCEFKKIGRVGTLPAMAHSSAPHSGLQMAIVGNNEQTQPQVNNF
jgi:hypothetical protein